MKEKNAAARKLYIIITGAISAGKTTLALNPARAIPNCSYLGKQENENKQELPMADKQTGEIRYSDKLAKAYWFLKTVNTQKYTQK